MSSRQITTMVLTSPNDAGTAEALSRLYRQFFRTDASKKFPSLRPTDRVAVFKCRKEVVGFVILNVDILPAPRQKAVLIGAGPAVILPDYQGMGLIQEAILKWYFKNWPNWLRGFQVYCWANCVCEKAYLGFTNNLLEYYPHQSRQSPATITTILQYLGERFYDTTLITRAGHLLAKEIILLQSAPRIGPKFRQHPDISFFTKANPDQFPKYGLLTVSPLHTMNILFAVKRLLGKKIRRLVNPKKF